MNVACNKLIQTPLYFIYLQDGKQIILVYGIIMILEELFLVWYNCDLEGMNGKESGP